MFQFIVFIMWAHESVLFFSSKDKLSCQKGISNKEIFCHTARAIKR